MISPRELCSPNEPVVAFDYRGVRVVSSAGAGPTGAVLVAGPVSDALKVVGEEGLVVGERKRDEMLQLEGFIVATSILGRVAGKVSPNELIEAIERLGHEWSVRSSFDP